jgi:RNA polymerase sigma-70 factor (ECF subfamily)
LAGDDDAFKQLVERHQTGLIHHLFRHTGQRELACDLAQEVFIKVYLALPRYDPTYRFTTWLYRIATNRAIDALRRKRSPEYSLDEPICGDEGGRSRGETLVGDQPSPDEALRYTELQRALNEAVANLPANYRTLFELRNRQQFRYDEIARITELPVGTVKNRIFRARALLRDALGDQLAPEGTRA